MTPYRPAHGTPIDDLDTPCLLVDLDALEHNQGVVADTYRDTVCKMAHHVKNTKCPLLAHMNSAPAGPMSAYAVPRSPRPRSWSRAAFEISRSPIRS